MSNRCIMVAWKKQFGAFGRFMMPRPNRNVKQRRNRRRLVNRSVA